MMNGGVKSGYVQTGAEVSLSYNRSNAAYFTWPHTKLHLPDSKSDKGIAIGAKWEVKWLW